MIHLPAAFSTLRDTQVTALADIAQCWNEGARVVFLDAPTGAGKTIIGVQAAIDAEMDKLLYVCTGHQLQAQFAEDFPEAKVLKGRANYPVTAGRTAADCNKVGQGESAVCSWCDPTWSCPYQQAKESAIRGPLAVVNTAYLLAEANYAGAFSGWDMIVVDEADELEAELMRHLEFRVAGLTARNLGLDLPKKGVHKPTLAKWLKELSLASFTNARKIDVDGEFEDEAARLRKQLMSLGARATQMAGWVNSDNWVRVYETSRRRGKQAEPADTLVLKPVSVADYAQANLWKHADRWLCMSATIISAQQMAEDLGLEDDEWRYVSVPSTFPPERRPIYVSGLGNMSRKTIDEGLPKVVEGIKAIVERHAGENILIHAHTYDNTRAISEALEDEGVLVWNYADSKSREVVIKKFRSQGGVLVAPSLARGIDLPDDLCRVVIIAKVPFPYMGDPQISERMHTENGQGWYDVQTVRAVVQMAGRGMRHEDDWCATYVVDGGFLKSCWRDGRLFPGWFKDAVHIVSAGQMLEGRLVEVDKQTVGA